MSEGGLEDGWELPLVVDDPAWQAHRDLADAVRELANLVVETQADEAALDGLVRGVRALTAELARHPHKSPRDAFAEGSMGGSPDRMRDRGAMLGRCNPASGPLALRSEGDLIVGEATYTSIHGGAPGFLHGGLVATVLDEVLGHVGIAAGAIVVTSSLTIRYLKPTPLDQPLRAEGWLVRREGRSWHTAGRILAGDRVTAEAEGVFVDVGRDRFARMFDETVK